MDNAKLVGYCGLYCDLCSARMQFPERVRALGDTMRKADYEDWGPGLEGFAGFWEFLQGLTEVAEDAYCRAGGCGAPDCAMRKCAQERGLTVCTECDEYPCDKIRTLPKSEPPMLYDGQHLKEIGLEAWVAEQEERKRAGFCYGDVRCGTAEVPRE